MGRHEGEEKYHIPGRDVHPVHYDGYGRLGELVHGERDGILEHFRYEYDIAGNKTAIMKDRRGLAADSGRYGYCYDPLGRLSGVTKDGHAVRAYTYDSFGNRKGMEDVTGGKTLSCFHDVLDRLVRVEEWGDGTDGSPSVTEYFYDGRGNMVREETGGKLFHGYEYGAMGRLSRAWDADGQLSADCTGTCGMSWTAPCVSAGIVRVTESPAAGALPTDMTSSERMREPCRET